VENLAVLLKGRFPQSLEEGRQQLKIITQSKRLVKQKTALNWEK
jgi:hypothetical protein